MRRLKTSRCDVEDEEMEKRKSVLFVYIGIASGRRGKIGCYFHQSSKKGPASSWSMKERID